MENYLQKIDLTHPRYLQTLVENRRIFNLRNCEFNVFESYQESYSVPLTFSDFVITSMIRGKKVMHLADKPAFNYIPGETVIVPANETMIIDFPEAKLDTPSQCIALAVDEMYIKDTLQYLDTFNNHKEDNHDWKLQFNKYHFENDTEITELINKLMRLCSSGDRHKNIYIDLNLKELLIRLVQSQHLQQILLESGNSSNSTRRHYVLDYIKDHVTEKITVDSLSRKAYLSRNMFFKWFKEQFGISPVEYINRERIKMAKQLLADSQNSISDVSMQCGFNDSNYFVRLFKKTEGVTPGTYQYVCRK